MKDFAPTLLRWYDMHGRKLPWRETHDPYAILVSEIMLQQTQVPRVLIKWQQWLARFPTAHALAHASTRDVLLAWQGMGYNSRALRLKACCEHVARHGWPSSPEALEELPGLGRYTAHAIACFAFGQRVPIVDVNVKLVLSPFLERDANDRRTWEAAWAMLPRKRFYDYNQALFDLGTVVRSGDLSSLPKKFQTLYAGVELTRKRQTEKRYGGFPMRLYRGALVQLLRDSPSHGASLQECQRHLAKMLSEQSDGFVADVVRRLEKDGIVVRQGDRVCLG